MTRDPHSNHPDTHDRHPSDRHTHAAVGSGDTTELRLEKSSFMVDKLGQDVLPQQDKRELTENAIQAVQRTGRPGTVVWDLDADYFRASGIRKLMVADTGDAFDATDLQRNLGLLVPAGGTHATDGNFGVGAKIAGVTRNPHGLVYRSWQQPDAPGVQAHLWRSPAGTYGFHRYVLDDGTYREVAAIDAHPRPAPVGDHGTVVTLLGTGPSDNTFAPPAGNPHGGKWLSRYLNTRYFEIPDGVEVQVREGDVDPDLPHRTSRMRTITGQRPWLDAHATDHDLFVGSDFRVWWWVLPAGGQGRVTRDSHLISRGFVAAKHQHELFELREGSSGSGALQRFGITFGFARVVLIVEPGVTSTERHGQLAAEHAGVDLQRAHLRHNGEPLDWDRYAAEFRADMPPQLEALVEDSSQHDPQRSRRRFRQAMEAVRELFELPRYRPSASGEVTADPDTLGPGGATPGGGRGGRTGPAPDRDRPGEATGSAGNVYPLRQTTPGVAARPVTELPDVTERWVSNLDPRLPERGELMEDRAATYIRETNTLLINADFRLFTTIHDHFATQLGDQPGADAAIVSVLRDVYAGLLVETVVGTLVLQGGQRWDEREFAQALSEEALTAAVMPRTGPVSAIRRQLTARFGAASVA